MILKMDKYRGNIVVSRKVISDNQLKEQRQKILSDITNKSKTSIKKEITDEEALELEKELRKMGYI